MSYEVRYLKLTGKEECGEGRRRNFFRPNDEGKVNYSKTKGESEKIGRRKARVKTREKWNKKKKGREND